MRNVFAKLAAFAALAAVGFSTLSVHAADWPSRPLTMIIMSKEGGGMDRASRMIGDAMSKELGQPMKYVNRPGASGEIALQSFLNAKNDGNTLFSGNIATLMVMYNSEKKDYSIDDLAWLGAYLKDPALLITHPNSGIESFEDFISAAQSSKQRVGVANWASVQTLALLQLIEQKELQVEIIPYSGFKKASTALLGQHIEAAIGNFAAVSKLKDQVKSLAIFEEDIPDGVEVPAVNSFYGLSVLNAASVRALGVHESLKTAHPERYEILMNAYFGATRNPNFVASFKSIGAKPSQYVEWDEFYADNAGVEISDLIAYVGDAFKR